MDIVPQLIANSVIAGAIYALITLGFNLIYGTTKFFNLAHGVIAAEGKPQKLLSSGVLEKIFLG